MLAEGGTDLPVLTFFSIYFLFKVGILAFAGLYFVFSLFVIRQIQLMTDTLITEVSPLIRAFGFLQAGLSLIVLILLVMLL